MMKKNTFPLLSYADIFPVRPLFNHIENYQYIVFAGLIFMELTLDHILQQQFIHLAHMVKTNEITKKHIVISMVLPNTEVSKLDNIMVGDKVSKINNIKVNTIEDVAQALVQAIRKNNKEFLSIEVNNQTTALLDLNNVIQQEDKLSEILNYPLSFVYQYYTQ
jgi:membrane-associated protease RseP (regulator of RpoE activity)